MRSAFQCLQLVITDFLPTIPYRCYPLCVETATKFGSQKAELNVSLTAIGLLWNLSDYFYQNVNQSKEQGEKANEKRGKEEDKDPAEKRQQSHAATGENVSTSHQLQEIFPEAFYHFQVVKIYPPLTSCGCVCIAD